MISEIWEFVQILRRPRWPAPQLAAYRRAKLRRLIDHAYQHVPYYRELMQSAGVRPEHIQDFPDLVRIPVTTKPMLREAGDRACSPSGLDPTYANLVTLHTSGHSGVPFSVRLTAPEYQTRRLREFRMLISAGVRPRDQLVLLGPTRVRPQRLHRRLGFYRTEVIPCTLSPEELLARFRPTRPDVLWVYPTVLKTVLYQAKAKLSDLVRPRILITSAQVMDPPFRRQLLAENPGLEIVDIYGSSEVGRIAAVCEKRRGLHIEEDALHVELLEQGQPVPEGEFGSVTITALDQLYAPLIRYEQGDLCRRKLEPCPCPRTTPLLDPPVGRNADMITLPHGQKISCAALDVALRDETDLTQYRFVQTSLTHIRAELCYRRTPDDAHLAALREKMILSAGQQIDFTIQLMPGLRLEGTKFKVFVSELPGPPQ